MTLKKLFIGSICMLSLAFSWPSVVVAAQVLEQAATVDAPQDQEAVPSSPASPTESRTIRVIQLDNLECESVRNIIATVYGGKISISADARSNSLVVLCDDEMHRQVEVLLDNLYKAAASSAAREKEAVQTQADGGVTIAYPIVDKPANVLRLKYEHLERQCLQLAERLRQPANGDGQQAESKQRLTKLVEQTFQARQDLQRAEVYDSARRLEKVQQNIETREALRADIVSRRVGELMNPVIVRL